MVRSEDSTHPTTLRSVILSPFHQHLVEVEQDVADQCPGGEFGDVGVFGGGTEGFGGQFHGVVGLFLKLLARIRAIAAFSAARSA